MKLKALQAARKSAKKEQITLGEAADIISKQTKGLNSLIGKLEHYIDEKCSEKNFNMNSDHEDAIKWTIEYLCDNNLLKGVLS